jgi:hypothetical protein
MATSPSDNRRLHHLALYGFSALMAFTDLDHSDLETIDFGVDELR